MQLAVRDFWEWQTLLANLKKLFYCDLDLGLLQVASLWLA